MLLLPEGAALGSAAEHGPRFASLMHAIQPLIPIPALLLVVPALWWFFRDTWRELDEDAQRYRGLTLDAGKVDYRPLVALVMVAVILTMQDYFGGAKFYKESLHPIMARLDLAHPKVIKLYKFDELYSFGWWVFARCFGYTVVPFGVWKIAFPEDSLLDMGLRARGFFHHAWIYLLFLAIVVPLLWIVSYDADFGAYYPFYQNASRSWYDFLSWEAMYFAQFFALEMFFRGFWLGALRRSFGSGAIFAMAVPYCMIHYGKPYLEASGAIVAGIALGSLSMKTKSIYQGFLVHVTLAGMMDWVSLWHRHALPHVVWPPN